MPLGTEERLDVFGPDYAANLIEHVENKGGGQLEELLVRPFLRKTVADALGNRRGCRYLCCGCGKLHNTTALADLEQLSEIVGVDYNAELISRAESVLAGLPRKIIRVMKHNLCEPIPADTVGERFDAGGLLFVCDYVDDTVVPQMLANIHAALRPGATFVLGTVHAIWSLAMSWDHPDGADVLQRLRRLAVNHEITVNSTGNGQYKRWIRPSKWYENALNHAGFVVTSRDDLAVAETDWPNVTYKPEGLGLPVFSVITAVNG